MSRVFFISKTTPATSTPETSMQAAFADIPNDDLDAVVVKPELPPVELPELPTAPLTISFTEILSEEDKPMRRSILSSFAASLNLMLVNAVRNHLVFELNPRNKAIASSVDARAEEDDRRGINAACYGQGDIEEASAKYAGNRKPMKPIELAKRFGVIRHWVHMLQSDCRSSTAHEFEPRALSESTDWLRSQQPVSTNQYDIVVRTMHAAAMGTKTIEQCVSERSAELAEAVELFKTLTPEIISLSDALTSGPFPDAQYVEQLFDELPPHTQVNVFIAAMNAIATAYKAANTKLSRYGNLSAAGDIMLLRAMHKRANATLRLLLTKHSRAIEEYEDRGASIKTLKPLV